MKPPNKPLHESCKVFNDCPYEKAGYRKNCGDCPLNPTAARVFTPAFVRRLILQSVLSFFIGALALCLLKLL